MRLAEEPSLRYQHVGLNSTELFRLEESCFSGDRISCRNWRCLLASPSAFCLGAFLDKNLVGSLVVLFRKNSKKARIYSLAVSSHVRGKGIGKGLLLQAEQEARKRGCDRLSLEVRSDNDGAIRLYTMADFCFKAEKPAYYEDGASAFVYQKELI